MIMEGKSLLSRRLAQLHCDRIGASLLRAAGAHRGGAVARARTAGLTAASVSEPTMPYTPKTFVSPMTAAATMIQRNWRGHRERVKFWAAVKAHRSWKQVLARSVGTMQFSRKATRAVKKRRALEESIATRGREAKLKKAGMASSTDQWGNVVDSEEELDVDSAGVDAEPAQDESLELRLEEAAILAELAELDAEEAEKAELMRTTGSSAKRKKFVMSAFFDPNNSLLCGYCCGYTACQSESCCNYCGGYGSPWSCWEGCCVCHHTLCCLNAQGVCCGNRGKGRDPIVQYSDVVCCCCDLDTALPCMECSMICCAVECVNPRLSDTHPMCCSSRTACCCCTNEVALPPAGVPIMCSPCCCYVCFPCGNKGCCKNLKQVNEKRITKAKSPSPRPASDGYASPSAAAPAAAAGTPERAAAANDMVR